MTPFRESARAAPAAPDDPSARARKIAVALTILLGLVAVAYFVPILPFGSRDISIASISREGLKPILATVPQFAAAIALLAMTLVARARGGAPSVTAGALLAAVPGAQLGWLAVELVPEVLRDYVRASSEWPLVLLMCLAASAAAIVVLARAFGSSRKRGWLAWRRVLGVYGAGMGVQALLLVFAILFETPNAAFGFVAFVACLALIAYTAAPRSES